MDLPELLKSEILKRGVIILADIFEDIDHPKYFAVMDVTAEHIVGFFFINSNIHHKIKEKQALLDLQYPLRKKDYDFLKYDSFLCATNIIERNKNEIQQSLEDKKSKVVGELQENHLNEILELVRNSRQFSQIDKRKYFS